MDGALLELSVHSDETRAFFVAFNILAIGVGQSLVVTNKFVDTCIGLDVSPAALLTARDELLASLTESTTLNVRVFV